ncbi:hypothetical protein MVEN_02547800 [Mycena venus]|uniref:Cyclic nucleotide-binding domain-containing protein n=1 Tax=Mycena venus TaxID=2733690 RepID=A0A8H6U3L8_9AGAR|nr:hypothetical protein MVEN_02547800 [Mycena venus]
MDDQMCHSAEESTQQSDPGDVGGNCHAAIVNTSSRDIIMTNCTTTTNFTFTVIPTAPSDFRTIPLGDIVLQHEICVDYCTGVISRGRTRTWHGAEEEWRRVVEKYRSIRHPNIIQIWGTASADGIHAVLFHDDLYTFMRSGIPSFGRCKIILTTYIMSKCFGTIFIFGYVAPRAAFVRSSTKTKAWSI